MGPENKQFLTKVLRSFDRSGKLTKVNGHTKALNLRTKKRVEDRKVESLTDEKVDEQIKPVLKLDPALIKQLRH